MIIAKYDLDKYPFHLTVRRIFDNVPLEQLHQRQIISKEIVYNDQDTALHKTVYRSLQEQNTKKEFNELYESFYRSLLPQFVRPTTGAWLVQAAPTFRFHCPGTSDVKEIHRGRDYGHPPGTIDIVVPLTKMSGTTAYQVEAAPYLPLFEPMAMELGQLCVFDGSNQRWGTQVNKENYTRVSFDFRVISADNLPPEGTVTVTQKMPIALGHYYREA